MKRRKFLRQIGFTGVAIAVTPTVLINEYPFVAAGTIDFTDNLITDGSVYCSKVSIGDCWKINHTTKEIIYQGGWNEDGVQLSDLYKFLKDEWKDDEPKTFKYPTIRTFGKNYSKSFDI